MLAVKKNGNLIHQRANVDPERQKQVKWFLKNVGQLDSLYAFKCKHFRNSSHTVTFGTSL
jgi:hypothetical protein